MGMSMHVQGIKPPDEKWKKMKKVWEACEAAGISIPDDVLEFFNNEEPDDVGVVVEQRWLGHAVREFEGDMKQGFEVDLKKLPEDITVIRVYASF